MTYATNRLDGTRIYFEDDGGRGVPVVLHGRLSRWRRRRARVNIARALPAGEFRTIYVDHRGLGRSDKPHEPGAYAMRRRVADAVAVARRARDRARPFHRDVVGRSAGLRGGPARARAHAVARRPRSATVRLAGQPAHTCGHRRAGGISNAGRRRHWSRRSRRSGVSSSRTLAAPVGWTTIRRHWRRRGRRSSPRGRSPTTCAIGASHASSASGQRMPISSTRRGRRPRRSRGAIVALAAADHYQAHVSEDEVLLDAVLDMLRANS